ncbi:MAG: PDZ domain-containing protein [Candidatus Hatepunaea meridiana]|nr:PDZ domain-containing protein [Candidatus Hatepunaea meridiana]
MKKGNHFQWVVLFAILFLLGSMGIINAKEIESETIIISDDKAFLGIYPDDLDDDDREALDFEGRDGVLIENVVDEGAAENAGIEAGDIITKMDGKVVASTKELRAVLRDHKPGDKIDIVVIRDGKEKTYKVELDEAPEHVIMGAYPGCFHKILKKGGFLGVEITELEGQLAEYFGVKTGVLIESVGEDSPAEKAGLMAGDVIVKIEDEEIEDVSDLIEEIRSKDPESEVEINIVRKGKKKTIKAKLGEKAYSDFDMSGKHHFSFDFDTVDFDSGDIQRIVKDALGNLDIHIDKGRDELQEGMKKLKEEMKKIREELKELKKEKKKSSK